MASVRKAVLRCMLAGALSRCAFSLNPALDIHQYAHKAWTVREGAFTGSIYAITQMPDGYLWIGSEFGLARFDGVRSVEWQPPKGEHLPGGRIRSLLTARDGSLWVGTDEGLATWKDNKLTVYAELAGTTVLSIVEDHEAIIWVAAWGEGTTYGRLCTIRGGTVECYGKGATLGSPIDGLYIDGVYEDRGGKLWVGSIDGVWRWKPTPAKFLPMPIVSSSFAEGDRGELFITTLGGIRTLVNEQAGPYLVRAAGRHSKFGRLLRDRDGGLWAGTYDGGLLHLYQGRINSFANSDGLSDDNILCLFEDREGSIWVGTRDGLDRFREFAVPTLTEKQGLSNSYVGSIVPARDGSIWLATLNGLDRWKNGQVAIYGERDGLPDPYALSLFEDQAGRIWVSTRRGVVYFERGRFVRVPGIQSGSVVCIVGDDAGGIWASDQGSLFHLKGQTVVEQIPWTKLGHNDFARIMLPDPVRGGLWLGFRQGGLAYYKDYSIRLSYGRDQGLGEGQVSGLKLDDDGSIWAATRSGLNLIRSGRIFRLSSANGLPCDIVHWVMEDTDHFFWLYTACGLARVARSELETWVADPKRTVSTTVFDNADGVPRNLTPTDSNPIVAKSDDGKIWFLPKNGVTVIDPRHLRVNKLPPPVHIEQITADDKSYPVMPGMRLPASVRDLRIDYTALSLVAPEKVRFKYILEGQDPGWREVTNERQAKYTNLAPRKYRFRVIAANNSGVWNETGDSLEFSIDPAYYQASWFYALCLGAGLAMVWGLFRLRVYQIAREFAAQTEERTRIARELHDTLLQSFQASLILMQGARNMFDRRPEKAVQSLDRAITTAAGAVAEGRRAIQDLRAVPASKGDLAQLLTAAGEELAHSEEVPGNPPVFRVTVEGDRRDLQPLLQDEVYRIARELLRNAFRHAQASRVEAEIRYESRQLRVHVRDDGKGIDLEILEAGGRRGHWGLPGMQERATRFGGKLEFWSEAGAGTEALLTVPAAVAYGTSDAGRFSVLRGKKTGA